MRQVWITDVTGRQAKQAAKMYQRAHWTHQDVADAMNWGPAKAARIIRLYEAHGKEVFAR